MERQASCSSSMPSHPRSEWDIEEVAEITARWARAHASDYPLWEIDEIHSEAFVIAADLLNKGRYKKEKAALSTFLWHALPLDIRHRYRRAHGQRYITDTDGKRRYKQVEFVGTHDADTIESNKRWNGSIRSIDLDDRDAHWLSARAAGFKASELRRRGMTYNEQRAAAERVKERRDGQQQK